MGKNDFDPEEVQRWFVDNVFHCWWCEVSGKPKEEWNRWDALHHICGRSGKYNNSLLNCAPMNNANCHINIHAILRRRENRDKLLQKTVSYLLEKGYEFNDTDKMFLYQNREGYINNITERG